MTNKYEDLNDVATDVFAIADSLDVLRDVVGDSDGMHNGIGCLLSAMSGKARDVGRFLDIMADEEHMRTCQSSQPNTATGTATGDPLNQFPKTWESIKV